MLGKNFVAKPDGLVRGNGLLSAREIFEEFPVPSGIGTAVEIGDKVPPPGTRGLILDRPGLMKKVVKGRIKRVQLRTILSAKWIAN